MLTSDANSEYMHVHQISLSKVLCQEKLQLYPSSQKAEAGGS
jgi:hypothetical protein